jgi:hypothetical protein
VAKIDPSAETQRLKTLYGGMEDSELAELGAQAGALADIARQVLSDELARRSMEPLLLAVPTQTKASREPIPPEPVMIRRYRDWPIAALAKSALDSAGIESFLADENLVRLDWFYSNLVGGIKLYVRPEDVADANKVLDDVVPEKPEGEAPAE